LIFQKTILQHMQVRSFYFKFGASFFSQMFVTHKRTLCNSISANTNFRVPLILPVQGIDPYPTCFLVSTPFPFSLIPLMTVHWSAKCYIRFNTARVLCTPLKKSFPRSVYRMNQFLKVRCTMLWQWRLRVDRALNKIYSYSFSFRFRRLMQMTTSLRHYPKACQL
jgi:hypothetical protein